MKLPEWFRKRRSFRVNIEKKTFKINTFVFIVNVRNILSLNFLFYYYDNDNKTLITTKIMKNAGLF